LGAGAWESEIPLYQEEGAQLETDYYVHNEFLQLVAEYGLVGWLFLLALLAYLVLAAWRSWRGGDADDEAERPWRAVFLCSLLALLVVSSIGFPWRLAATGALFAVCLGGLAGSDARLGFTRPWLARPLPWSPRIGQAALAGVAACFVLAVVITDRAAESERKLVRAAQLALGISQSGQPERSALRCDQGRTAAAGARGDRDQSPLPQDHAHRGGRTRALGRLGRCHLDLGKRARLPAAHRRHPDQRGARPRRHGPPGPGPGLPGAGAPTPAARARGARAGGAAAGAHGPGGEGHAARAGALDAGVVDYELVNSYFILAWRAHDWPRAEQLLQLRMREWPESRARGLVQLGLIYNEGWHDRARALAAFQLALKVASLQERDALLQQVPAEFRAQLVAAPAPQTSASSR
jgi:hypothetical protein